MKILIIKLSSMGDIISTLPAVTDAKQALGAVEFDWVVEENFTEIPRWHQAVHAVIPIALRRLRKTPWSLAALRELQVVWHKLREARYDYILDAQGLLKSAIVAKIARGVTYGFNLKNSREPLAACFYRHPLAISKHLHAVERARQLFAQALGYKVATGSPNYGIKERFDSNNTAAKYLVFVHGASRSNKWWQEEKWLELAKFAQRAGLAVKLPWGNAAELARAKRLAASAGNIEILPPLSLTAIGSILLGAQGVVALDTGFSHLAAALSVPAISLYGPTKPQLAGTYGAHQTHLINMANLEAQAVWHTMQHQFAI